MNIGRSDVLKSSENKNLKKKIIQYLCVPFMAVCSAVSPFTHFQFFTWVWYVFQVFLLWVTADFITGIIHWWEDTYGNPNWPIIGKYIVEPNLIHHKQPNKLLEGSYWNRINTSFIAATFIGLILFLFGMHSWQIILCLILCVQANEIHAMSHRSDKSNGILILFLQEAGIFQSRRVHRWHHKAPYETNFCIMSDFVNPILNKIEFWKKLEWLILKVFRIKILRGSTIRNGL